MKLFDSFYLNGIQVYYMYVYFFWLVLSFNWVKGNCG